MLSDLDPKDLIVPRNYGVAGQPHDLWTVLREHAPVYRCAVDEYEHFWAITRHADVLEISKRADVFVNSQRLRLQLIEEDERQFGWSRARAEARGWDPDEVPDFIFMIILNVSDPLISKSLIRLVCACTALTSPANHLT